MAEIPPLLSVEHLKVTYPKRSSILLRKTGENVRIRRFARFELGR